MQPTTISLPRRLVPVSILAVALLIFLAPLAPAADTFSAEPSAGSSSYPLELLRTERPWEFLPVTGTRAGLFGNEAGQFEAWVYPLKILRGFHLRFHIEVRVIRAESLARNV